MISGVAAGEPYTTRILLRCPADPTKFSGVAVEEPSHIWVRRFLTQQAKATKRGERCTNNNFHAVWHKWLESDQPMADAKWARMAGS